MTGQKLQFSQLQENKSKKKKTEINTIKVYEIRVAERARAVLPHYSEDARTGERARETLNFIYDCDCDDETDAE